MEVFRNAEILENPARENPVSENVASFPAVFQNGKKWAEAHQEKTVFKNAPPLPEDSMPGAIRKKQFFKTLDFWLGGYAVFKIWENLVRAIPETTVFQYAEILVRRENLVSKNALNLANAPRKNCFSTCGNSGSIRQENSIFQNAENMRAACLPGKFCGKIWCALNNEITCYHDTKPLTITF